MNARADICLILEGSYPYVAGGVSSWMHELIQGQPDKTFHVMALTPATGARELRYELPANVVGFDAVPLALPAGARISAKRLDRLFADLAGPLMRLLTDGDLADLEAVIRLLAPHGGALGREALLDSPAAWRLVQAMYAESLPETSFLDYFWSWRALMGGLFQMLSTPLPAARAYHSISTGYAGLLAARARLETRRPAFLTEHGVYTNERRIEITMATWLHERAPTGFSLKRSARDLRDFWIDAFRAYARVCYQATDPIVTLYGDNQIMQRRDGAPEAALRIIPNGVDFKRFSAIERAKPDARPCIALIGRVTPIKDVKTFIRSAAALRKWFPDLLAYVLGPTEEDPGYAAECRTLANHLGLDDVVQFTGPVRIDEYLGRIDVLVLTSLSEAQPLVVLEAGAAGVPSVTTDVGCCRELLYGAPGETPGLGAGGAVAAGADPEAVASAIAGILGDPDRRTAMGEAMRARVGRFYDKPDIMDVYGVLYDELVATPDLPSPFLGREAA